MKLVLSSQEIGEGNRHDVGGKGFALSRMVRHGIKVPPFVCVTVEAYKRYVASTGLDAKILFELNRKNFKDMRWEEIWDASLRVRNLFVTMPIPADIYDALKDPLEKEFGGKTLVVRSSAPGEDSSNVSFAGLHESYVNISGIENILDHLRLVWASLWSDRAILYRKELGLTVEGSSMAAVVQELLLGDRSGVIFTMNPVDASQAVVEAVYGLNQGLVDGTVEPDRWILNRSTGAIISHREAKRETMMAPSPAGVALGALPEEKRLIPPLNSREIKKVFRMARQCESLFTSPQDVEYTLRGESLYTLQSRPITTVSADSKGDLRPWYLSLTRSFENLKLLRRRIEDEIIPAMDHNAKDLAAINVKGLDDPDLADEIGRRTQIHRGWLKVYDDDCIPFAHGMRLFGQVYNDVLRPDDPYEFMDLLRADRMESLERNRLLEELAAMIRDNRELKEALTGGRVPRSPSLFWRRFKAFRERFGESVSQGMKAHGRPVKGDPLVPLLREMADHSRSGKGQAVETRAVLEERFLSHFKREKLTFGRELLDLGRASYRWRDDDNIFLGRIEAQVQRAVNEGRKRLKSRAIPWAAKLEAEEVVKVLKDRNYVPPKPAVTRQRQKKKTGFMVRARQLTGQPAGPGIATGTARVILNPPDLLQFKAGEILVCDAVDPTMTFVVPLSAGIVERRGGMLIHGAIIAREYGLPCVTGIPDVTSLIRTGDRITVDGYLGIVIVG